MGSKFPEDSPEGRLDLVGECTGGEAASNGCSADVAGKLEAGTLGIGPAQHNNQRLGPSNFLITFSVKTLSEPATGKRLKIRYS